MREKNKKKTEKTIRKELEMLFLKTRKDHFLKKKKRQRRWEIREDNRNGITTFFFQKEKDKVKKTVRRKWKISISRDDEPSQSLGERKIKETRKTVEKERKISILERWNNRRAKFSVLTTLRNILKKSMFVRWDDVDELRIIFREVTGCFLSLRQRVEYCFRIESRCFRSSDRIFTACLRLLWAVFSKLYNNSQHNLHIE